MDIGKESGESINSVRNSYRNITSQWKNNITNSINNLKYDFNHKYNLLTLFTFIFIIILICFFLYLSAYTNDNLYCSLMQYGSMSMLFIILFIFYFMSIPPSKLHES